MQLVIDHFGVNCSRSNGVRGMTSKTNNATQTLHQCWSCNAEIVPTNIFCPNCGTWLLADGHEPKKPTTAPSNKSTLSISAANQPRTVAGTIILGGALLFLGGWILLQLFGSGLW
jgi:predicted RNA-binding Zn-ribbon protein involved in translation (DUF1610 family)